MEKGVEYKFKDERFKDLIIVKFGKLLRVFSKTPYKEFYREGDVHKSSFYVKLPSKWLDRMNKDYGFNYNMFELMEVYGELKPYTSKLEIPTSILSVI